MDSIEEIHDSEENPEELQESKTSRGKTWLIALVGIVALLVGLGLGYFGRGEFGPEAQAAKGTATAVAAAVQTRSATNEQVMDLIIAQTNHFQGEANAPVTILEFSDFQ
jgi:flagellar basal body-associated protein FliL